MYNEVAFNELEGKTLTDISITDNGGMMTFIMEDGSLYTLFGDENFTLNDCRVWLEEIHGDLTDLIGNRILQAEEVNGETEGVGTWTFFKLATEMGSVTLRWCGESNGYYSERPVLNKG